MERIESYIDHTNLKADASEKDIKQLCFEAKEHNFFAVCVNPGYVKLCSNELKESDVKVCTVIGFPLGATTTKSKVAETKIAIEDGADEIDVVINISKLKDKDDDYVLNELKEVVEAASGRLVKVIIETALLNDEEKVRASKLSAKAKANYVKTSTGFSTGGATVEDVKLMKSSIPNNVLVKASGGVRTYDEFLKMVNAGASRVGTSNGVKIAKKI